ncbi:MAG: hypothetical protein GX220_00530 [Treponema sp.]|nr:hypothetical protein [Treponema sp.]
MNSKKLFSLFLFCIILLLCFISCNSIPKEIPENVTPEQLLRNAQESFDKLNYKAAEYYYNAAISRTISNPKMLLQAEFELAHMYVKLKNYKKAQPILQRLLESYNAPEAQAYPQSYKKLIELDLEKIQQN